MGFQAFPADRQSLPVLVHLVHDDVHSLTRSQVLLRPMVTLGPKILQRIDAASSKDMLSGWDVVEATAHEMPHVDFSSQFARQDPGAFGHCATSQPCSPVVVHLRR
jgi:hypothetical protein